MIRVILPAQLCSLASIGREIDVQVQDPITVAAVLDALEVQFPMLRGTIRDQVTLQRRPFIRFFVGGEDFSQDPPTNPLPEEVVMGKMPLRVVGAMAGG
ncbi:MAG TPA: MoaD/ThiS family protein [Anaerolineales bacterium]|nr:MoaD/ThiS family protein [Anaerolineales bacterium]